MKERNRSTPLLSLIVVGLLALACGFPQPGPASTLGIASTPEAQPTTEATPPPITVLTMPPTPAADSESMRSVPIRWVELHAPDHPECRRLDGTAFAGPLPATDPGAWRSSERLSWTITRTNDVYAGTGIQFWLQSYDVYCTETLARREGDADTLYSWSEVRADLQMIFPHAQFYDLSADRLSRMRWIEKAFLLYGDRHGKMVVVHNDHVQGIEGARHSPDILPQHGFGPWYTPGVVFMFLSADTWAANWQFAPEMTLAHEIAHSLGNCHTLDFDRCIGPGGTGDAIFPDRSSYTWADHWDLAYVDNGGVITGFESHD